MCDEDHERLRDLADDARDRLKNIERKAYTNRRATFPELDGLKTVVRQIEELLTAATG